MMLISIRVEQEKSQITQLWLEFHEVSTLGHFQKVSVACIFEGLGSSRYFLRIPLQSSRSYIIPPRITYRNEKC